MMAATVPRAIRSLNPVRMLRRIDANTADRESDVEWRRRSHGPKACRGAVPLAAVKRAKYADASLQRVFDGRHLARQNAAKSRGNPNDGTRTGRVRSPLP